MTDDQLNELMALAAKGDNDAQLLIDTWIARALAPLCATPSLADGVRWLDAEPECCPLCEERLAA